MGLDEFSDSPMGFLVQAINIHGAEGDQSVVRGSFGWVVRGPGGKLGSLASGKSLFVFFRGVGKPTYNFPTLNSCSDLASFRPHGDLLKAGLGLLEFLSLAFFCH